MLTDKEMKKQFKAVSQKEPEKYYPVETLKTLGYERKQCKSCKTFYWTATDREVCGDASCSEGFKFIGDTPAKNELTYIEVWQKFSELFSKLGYTPIKRYPSVSRWNPTTDFTIASISAFQPYVVTGEIEPPAKKLVIPQFCLRFNDIDNVGITGAHYTGFVMIGQHAFVKPQEYDINKYLQDIYTWLDKGIGLKKTDITFHEDAWAGGGNFGPSMEYFSRGLELGNQVYMQYEQTQDSYKELNIKVLDMGMGHERNAWFTKGTSTSYETTFPTVCKKLYNITGHKSNELMRRFLPYASYLNIDEVENIDSAWNRVANLLSVDVKELKSKILPLAALYSIGEHTRTLLVSLADGAIPSNVGGYYNLRIILRRALSMIDKYNWEIDLGEMCEIHADYLKQIFPELKENIEDTKKILSVEKEKYIATKKRSELLVKKLVEKQVTDEQLLQIYDSHGISPELIKSEAEKIGREITIPDNFYIRVAELHEKNEQVHQTKREEQLDLEGVQDTEALYFDDYLTNENTAKVLMIIQNKVILDKTVAYPTSGGQLHDLGNIDGEKILDVFKQGGIIIHALEKKPDFKTGDTVKVYIDLERRKQLAQHHTSTHIVNAAARKVLGNHINQAGAKKTKEKATLDITHYISISDEELKQIEKEANKIVKSRIKVQKFFLGRREAEEKFGMRIYQGGAVPGKKLRIVQIADIDIECCGGTHLNNTEEAGEIKLIDAKKISDGVVRITFVAGKALKEAGKQQDTLLDEIAKLLECETPQIPSRADELFRIWKDIVKKGKDMKFELKSTETFEGDVLGKTAEILKTQPQHVINTIRRFLDEIKNKGK